MKCAHATPIELRTDAAGSTSWLWCPRCGAVRMFGYVPSGADLALYRWHAPGTTRTSGWLAGLARLMQQYAAEKQALAGRLAERAAQREAQEMSAHFERNRPFAPARAKAAMQRADKLLAEHEKPKRAHRRTHREDDGSLIDPPEGSITTSGGGSPDWQAEAIGKGGSLPPKRVRLKWVCPYCDKTFKTFEKALAHDHECEGGR